MSSFSRKARRAAEKEQRKAAKGGNPHGLLPEQLLTEAEYNDLEFRIKQQVIEQVIVKVLAVALMVIMEHWHKISVRKTRVDSFAELFINKINTLYDDEGIDTYIKILERYKLHINWK